MKQRKETVISIEHLFFSFDSLPVIQDLSLKLNTGEFCTLVGSNGAGKSSLVKLILGELQRQSGEVSLFGGPLESFASWNRLGYLPQCVNDHYRNFPATVLELVQSNLVRELAWYKPFGATEKRKALEALEMCDIAHIAHAKLGELSGGQRQRVLLARALVAKPELLILDEPTNALDAQSSHRLVALLEELTTEQNLTTLMITHDLCCIPNSCTQVLELEHGRVRPFEEVAHLAGQCACEKED